MNGIRTAGMVLLLASIGGNVVLARTRARSTPSTTADGEGAPAEAAHLTVSERGAVPVACGGDVAQLEAEVSDKSVALRGLMPAEVLFAAGQPNPAAERLMASIVAEAIGGLGTPARDHRLSCKDVACQLVFRESAALPEGSWERAIGGHAGFRSWTSEFGLSDARPVDDAETRAPLVERTIYFKLRPGPIAVDTTSTSEARVKAAETAARALEAGPSATIRRAPATRGGKQDAHPHQ